MQSDLHHTHREQKKNGILAIWSGDWAKHEEAGQRGRADKGAKKSKKCAEVIKIENLFPFGASGAQS